MSSNNTIENNSFTKIKQTINNTNDKYIPRIEKLISVAEKINKACDEISKSWSNSFAGYHGRLYYKDFEEPSLHNRFNTEWGCVNGLPDGWNEKNPEVVKQKIEELVDEDISLTQLEIDEKKLSEEFIEIQREMLILFSTFSFKDEDIQEKKLLSEIEEFKFSKKLGHFMKKMMPRSIRTRDSRAINEGICQPSHIYYKAVALLIINTCNSIKIFLKTADRLTRQLEIKHNITKQKPKAGNKKNYWNYVNPIWLLWKLILQFFSLLKVAWRHKIISVIITTTGLLATDYTILGNNALKLILFIKKLFV